MSIRKKSTDSPKAKKEKAPKASKKDKTSGVSLNKEEGSSKSPKVKKSKKPVSNRPKVIAPKDRYTLVLLLSFLFFATACVFLFLDLGSYK